MGKSNFTILQENKIVWIPSYRFNNIHDPCATKFLIPKGSIEVCDENKNCFAGRAIILNNYCLRRGCNYLDLHDSTRSLENHEIFHDGSSITNYSYENETLQLSSYNSFIESKRAPPNENPSRYNRVKTLLENLKKV